MDKQREDEICKIFEDIVKKHPDATADEGSLPDDMRFIPLEFWQAVQAAMQPDIDRLASDKDELNDLAEKQEQQLSAANQRNKELQSENETCRNLMRIKQEQNDAFSQRITELLDLVEVVERHNKQLEERIRVADAEDPVLLVVVEENDGGTLSHRISWSEANQLPLGYWPMFVHAQIPAEVELKAKIAELEAIIKASQEQEPIAYVDSEQLRRWDVLRGTDYESPERCYMPWSRDRFKTDLTNCDFPVYAAPVIKEQP